MCVAEEELGHRVVEDSLPPLEVFVCELLQRCAGAPRPQQRRVSPPRLPDCQRRCLRPPPHGSVYVSLPTLDPHGRPEAQLRVHQIMADPKHRHPTIRRFAAAHAAGVAAR
jgi:hypothetical protein